MMANNTCGVCIPQRVREIEGKREEGNRLIISYWHPGDYTTFCAVLIFSRHLHQKDNYHFQFLFRFLRKNTKKKKIQEEYRYDGTSPACSLQEQEI